MQREAMLEGLFEFARERQPLKIMRVPYRAVSQRSAYSPCSHDDTSMPIEQGPLGRCCSSARKPKPWLDGGEMRSPISLISRNKDECGNTFFLVADIQEFYELTLLDESKSVQQKTAETIRIADKWEASDGPITPTFAQNDVSTTLNPTDPLLVPAARRISRTRTRCSSAGHDLWRLSVSLFAGNRNDYAAEKRAG